MNQPFNLMAVLAHPEDESLSFGGTLANYAAEARFGRVYGDKSKSTSLESLCPCWRLSGRGVAVHLIFEIHRPRNVAGAPQKPGKIVLSLADFV